MKELQHREEAQAAFRVQMFQPLQQTTLWVSLF